MARPDLGKPLPEPSARLRIGSSRAHMTEEVRPSKRVPDAVHDGCRGTVIERLRGSAGTGFPHRHRRQRTGPVPLEQNLGSPAGAEHWKFETGPALSLRPCGRILPVAGPAKPGIMVCRAARPERTDASVPCRRGRTAWCEW
ncbi:hypothetical protein MOX02_02980 [Methylobacterium oxalidis]|uniref:Uncharacterized protein n=1 Tax=Methylobacterium oxalidis TaxID=944322 RepID=A0A512IX13_9HYPH|nr:hypothetical protein MOX02_02980 [Methylobacterium oxalidis]GLS62205.1 hypothetical protein GCM10007888_05860 [Methylobacterium oxalidis]